MSECNFGSGIRCDKCRRLISLTDFQSGAARSELTTMKCETGAPEYRDLCPACVRVQNNEQAQVFAAICEKVGL